MTTEVVTTGPRIIAKFRAQAWINDYAVNTDDSYDFDATDLLLSWPKERVLAIEDYDYEADAVWQEHPISTEQPWNGPFAVEVADAIATFLEAVGAEYVWGETPTYRSVVV